MAGAVNHAAEADRRDEESSIVEVRSSFAVSAFHRNATSLAERFTMGDVCLTAWKRKNMGQPFPGIRLTRCCVRLISCRRSCMDEVGFLPDFFGLGTLPGVPPVDGCILLRKNRFVIKPVVETENSSIYLLFPGNKLTNPSQFHYNHICFTAFT